MPVKIKLKLPSSILSEQPSTPSKGQHVPSTPSNAEAGPSRSKSLLPSISALTPARDASAAVSSSTKAQVSPNKVSSSVTKGKSKGRPPTAIPPHLASSNPSTPKTGMMSLPIETPISSALSTPVKSETEDDIDPLSLPLSPAAMEISTPTAGSAPSALPTPAYEKPAPKFQRTKKPLKELLNKIMVELRKRDEYALFDEPVDLETFPDYLSIVGGEDKMMDLGTMQSKVDDGEYRSLDDLEADLNTLVSAAQKFNPTGTIPYNSAAKILSYGQKHIERSRPIVRTPSPSPERAVSGSATPARGQSTFSTREGTAALHMVEIPPESYIPVEMLEYPPNSLYARAVGWSMNGGRHIWSKRQIRGREKFNGKWRHWSLDGARDMAELEDVDDWFATHKTVSDPTSRKRIDWQAMRDSGNVWWETELGGPQGQPPIPFTQYAKPTPMKYKEYKVFDFGNYRTVDEEMTRLARTNKTTEAVILEEHLHPIRRKPLKKESAFTNTFDGSLDIDPRDALREVVFGGLAGEAYNRSLDEFVKGAMKLSDDGGEEKAGDRIALTDWVADRYRGGLGTRQRTVMRDTLGDLEIVTKGEDANPRSSRQEQIHQIAKREYGRRALKVLASPEHPLDLRSLLQDPSDFVHTGVRARVAIKDGLDWTSKEIGRLADLIKAEHEEKGKRERDDDVKTVSKRIKLEDANGISSAASSPLTQPPDSPIAEPVPEKTRQQELKALRLELVALSKFYPLVALKKFSEEDAERLLPAAVRSLLAKKAMEKKPSVG